MNTTPIAVFWHRRDLRLHDNAGLHAALKSGLPVLPLFIFDTDILDKLSNRHDARVQFIYKELERMQKELEAAGSGLLVKYGKPCDVWKQLLGEWNIQHVFTNHDYEPYARQRDSDIQQLLAGAGIPLSTFKDHVIFEKSEVVKDDGLPYTVFTPYSRKWRAKLTPFYYRAYPVEKYARNFLKFNAPAMPVLQAMNFYPTQVAYPERVIKSEVIKNYSTQRDFPAVNGTSRLGIHLRFGTLSVRKLLGYALDKNQTYVNELIWRDFYQQILWHFPHVAHSAFRKEYDTIEWVNNEEHFARWCRGETGYPLVDAGMRELNATGYMHNRVRMVVASFLTKHLLIDWRWGEAYFAEKLLDFDMAANSGGWQWAAGCGTDAAPYFRIFNPEAQQKKFDPTGAYIRQWVPEYGTPAYPVPIVEHSEARERCLRVYQQALKK